MPHASPLTRRAFLVTSAAAAAAAAAPPVAAQTPRSGGTLRIRYLYDLRILDPIYTYSYVTRDFGYMIYDTLFATDAQGQIRPQMVERHTVSRDGLRYTFALRDGLQFHDGQPVSAEDCVVSLQRWGKKDLLGKLLFAATARLAATDRKSFVLELKEPFGLVLEALGKPSSHVPFIMPARLAATSENEQVKEQIGSGPYRFLKDEWRPGHQVVFARNPDYVPRAEPASGAAGGKRVHLDRVVWRSIPDPATTAAALQAGEIDMWPTPPLDFIPRLEKDPNLAVFDTDPQGSQGWIRFNHLHPPFSDKRARRAVVLAIDQETFLQAAVGHPRYYRTCGAYFMCGGPYESLAGARSGPPDLDRARQLVKESGYDGRPVVVLDPTDLPDLHGASLATRDLLRKLGMTVDLQAMEFMTLSARRAKREAPREGGWNLFLTKWISPDAASPATNVGLSGACERGYFGWYCSAEMERLRGEWMRTTDPARRKQLADQIQILASEDVPHVLWGQYQEPSVARKTVRGHLQFPVPLHWNLWLDA
jgi:peptide/nickel transport system substrate-binding protein